MDEARLKFAFHLVDLLVKGFTEEFVTTDIYCKQAVSDR